MTQILPNEFKENIGKTKKGVFGILKDFGIFMKVLGFLYLVLSVYFTSRYILENINIYFNK